VAAWLTGNAIVGAFMREMGVPQQVIDLQLKADPCCFNHVDHAQAEAWGLLSDRKHCARRGAASWLIRLA
jgi:hypothetical protein